MNKLPTLLNHQLQTQLANDSKKNRDTHDCVFFAIPLIGQKHNYNSFEKGKSKWHDHIQRGKKELAFPIKANGILVHHSLIMNRISANINPFRTTKACCITYRAIKNLP